MTCVELQQSLAEIDDGSNAAQQSHLKDCPACSALVADLTLMITAAAELREVEEPSPRVWNSIASTLREERLIRPLSDPRASMTSFGARWGWARWMVPAAAMLLILLGIYANQRSHVNKLASNSSPVPISEMAGAYGGMNDADLLVEVSDHAPLMRTQYEDSLRRVNQSIRDAQTTVDADPNDQEARQSLMDAYGQKAMLFEMAMDRSLP
jgi:hypothetical protein